MAANRASSVVKAPGVRVANDTKGKRTDVLGLNTNWSKEPQVVGKRV